MAVLARFNDFVLALFRRLCIAACAVMVAAIAAQVVLRYGFSVGLAWAEELARMAMIFFAFLSAPILYRRGETIAVTALQSRLPPGAAKLFAAAVHLAVLLLAAAFVKLSWDFTVAGAKIRALSLPVTMHYVYAVMPVSFFVFVLVAAEMVGKTFSQNKTKDISQNKTN